MASLNLTYTLISGTPENVNQLQQDLIDIQTWANGSVGGSNLSVSDPVAYANLAILDACRVYNSANISIANATATALTFDTERFDTNGLHSTSSNTGRLTCQRTGLYAIFVQVDFAANGTGTRQVYVRLNGTTIIAQDQRPAGTTDAMFSFSTQYPLTATDYVELVVVQSSGGALNVNASGNFSPEFGMTYLGRIA